MLESAENEGEKKEMMEIDVVVQILTKFRCWPARTRTIWRGETRRRFRRPAPNLNKKPEKAKANAGMGDQTVRLVGNPKIKHPSIFIPYSQVVVAQLSF